MHRTTKIQPTLEVKGLEGDKSTLAGMKEEKQLIDPFTPCAVVEAKAQEEHKKES